MLTIDEIHELEALYERAKDFSTGFTEATKIMAEKHQLDPQGLGKFIRAKVNDKQAKLNQENETIEQLQMSFLNNVDEQN